MARLTRRSKAGEGLPVKHLNIRHEDTTSEDTLTEILEKLAAYEDIGPTPEQLLEIDKMYSEKCREVAELKKQLGARETGDLISRKALLGRLKGSFQNINYHPDFGDPAVGMEQELFNEFLHDMIKLVEKQTTAYDVEKVVDKLEHDAQMLYSIYAFEPVKAWKNDSLIPIVKGGGVNE